VSYDSEISNLQFQGNVIIRVADTYFSIRQPDSGLTVQRFYNGLISSVVLSPTQVDVKRVTSTIAQFSFKLIDRSLAVSNLVQGDASRFLGEEVEIWLGRSGVSLDFEDYLKLQTTRVKKVDYVDGAYTFATAEETDRINKPIYQESAKLSGDMAADSTSFLSQTDISGFPSSGYLKIDREVVSYTAKNDDTRIFSGLVRGEFSTTPATHSDGADVYQAETITGNPVDIVLKLLLSPGGGSDYDVLNDGAGIDVGLIDLSAIEDLRDELFPDTEFSLLLSRETSALKFIETELLAVSDGMNITLRQFDPMSIREPDLEITDDSIRPWPRWSVDANQIVNRIEVEWDYSEDSGKYLEKTVFEDADSIASYGRKSALTFRFKGIQSDLDGATLIEDFGNRMIGRLAYPSPEIQITTHMDKSLIDVLDRPLVTSSLIPNHDGGIHFANELEVISKAVNYQTGDVTLKLVFNSGTFNRMGYISPSDSFVSAASTVTATIGAGRGSQWRTGWKVRLWDNDLREYMADPVNEIESITTDTITFADAWATDITADPTRYKVLFADYEEVTDDQRRYGFISATGAEVFFDGKKRYCVTF
jgi:hypothetical protein